MSKSKHPHSKKNDHLATSNEAPKSALPNQEAPLDSSTGEALNSPVPPSEPPPLPLAPVVAAPTVGEIIHKERATKRITVETIAKDLRLNVRYIKALEANQYDSLPGDPYVRVYLRSIAKYLMLDPETVLKKFYEEKGLAHEQYPHNTQTKLDVTIIDSDTSQKPWFVIVAIIIGLALLVVVIGSISKRAPSQSVSTTIPVSTIDSIKNVPPIADTAKPDSIMGDSIKEIPPDSAAISQI